MKSFFSICAVAMAMVGAAGCAVDVEEEDELVDDVEEALVNKDVVSTKLCARVERETPLYRHPTGNERPETVNGRSTVGPRNGWKYVLVQREPGNVDGRVWADPDFYGLRDTTDATLVKSVARRCGLKKDGKLNLTAAKKVMRVAAEGEPYNRRGWIEAKDLDNLPRMRAVRPNGAAAQPRDFQPGTTKLKDGTVKRVKASCVLTAGYRGGNPKDPTGTRSYGTCLEFGTGPQGQLVCDRSAAEMYVNYNIPEIDNGGMTFGYIAVGAPVHVLRMNPHNQTGEHCQTVGTGPGAEARCNGSVPASQRAPVLNWAEIWARTGGRTVRGFVPEPCLE